MEKLYTYAGFPQTSSCYLDGRYFSLVLAPYCSSTVKIPIVINLDEDSEGRIQNYSVYSKFNPIDPSIPLNFIRVIIQSKYKRHSTLLICDSENKTFWWWNPRAVTPNLKRESSRRSTTKASIDANDAAEEEKAKKFNRLNAIIRTILNEYLRKTSDFTLKELVAIVPSVSSPKCEKSGFCNAYVLKCVIDILSKKIDLEKWPQRLYFSKSKEDDILRFANMIEISYSSMLKPNSPPDIEYDMSSGTGALLGGVGGMVLGGAVGGMGGALLGGVGGALIGGALTSSQGTYHNSNFKHHSKVYEHSHTEYKRCKDGCSI